MVEGQVCIKLGWGVRGDCMLDVWPVNFTRRARLPREEADSSPYAHASRCPRRAKTAAIRLCRRGMYDLDILTTAGSGHCQT